MRLTADHDEIGTVADARSPELFVIDVGSPGGRVWRVKQILDDPDGDHDWQIWADIDLAASDEVGEAVVRVTRVGRL